MSIIKRSNTCVPECFNNPSNFLSRPSFLLNRWDTIFSGVWGFEIWNPISKSWATLFEVMALPTYYAWSNISELPSSKKEATIQHLGKYVQTHMLSLKVKLTMWSSNDLTNNTVQAFEVSICHRNRARWEYGSKCESVWQLSYSLQES